MQGLNMQIDIVKKATQSKYIKDCNDREIAEKLSIIYYMIGLRPQHFPTQQEDAFLFNYIKFNYGFRGIEELVIAFDLAIKDVLDIEDVKVYDQFSPEYLNRIMNGYKKHITFLAKNIQKPTKLPEALPPPPMTREDKIEEIKYWSDKMDSVNKLIVPIYIYDYLIDCELVKMNDERFNQYLIMACEMEIREFRNKIESGEDRKMNQQLLKEFMAMYDSGCFTGTIVSRLQSNAKKIFIKKYLNKKNNGNRIGDKR